MMQRWQKIINVLSHRQHGLTVLLEKVHKPHNFSAILRTCDAVGIAQAHVVLAHKQQIIKSTATGSAHKWVDIKVHPTFQAAHDELSQQNITTYCTRLSDNAIDYRNIDYTKPTAIIFGTEKFGVTAEAAALCDYDIKIPMMGMVQSLNVSVACAIILYEAQRQRQQAGLYKSSTTNHNLFKKTAFEWMHPKIAKHCQKLGVDYPDLDENGDVVGNFPR